MVWPISQCLCRFETCCLIDVDISRLRHKCKLRVPRIYVITNQTIRSGLDLVSERTIVEKKGERCQCQVNDRWIIQIYKMFYNLYCSFKWVAPFPVRLRCWSWRSRWWWWSSSCWSSSNKQQYRWNVQVETTIIHIVNSCANQTN